MLFTYIWLLPTATLLAFLTQKEKRKSNQTIFYLLLLVLLIFVSATRYQNYYNTDEYRYRLISLNFIGQEFDVSKLGLLEEPGAYLLMWTLANLFHSDQAYVVLTAVLTNYLVLTTMKKDSPNFALSIFLYIAGGIYFYSFSAIRQYFAAAIILYASKYITLQDFKKYLFWVFIASLFHSTSWVMLLVYFVPRIKDYRKLNLALLAGSAFLSINMYWLLPIILSNTKYYYYLDMDYYGVNVLRVLAWCIPYGILLYYCRRIKPFNNRQIFLTEMCVFSMCCYIVALSFVYAARLEIYFGLLALCALPYLLYLFEKKSRTIILWIFASLFAVYGAYSASLLPAYNNYFVGTRHILY